MTNNLHVASKRGGGDQIGGWASGGARGKLVGNDREREAYGDEDTALKGSKFLKKASAYFEFKDLLKPRELFRRKQTRTTAQIDRFKELQIKSLKKSG